MTSDKRKRLLVGLAVVVLAVIVVLLVLPRVFDLNRYRDAIANKIQETTGGNVSLDNISWNIAGGLQLEVDGLTVRDAVIFPGDIKLPRVHAAVSILPLLNREFMVEELRLDRPVLTLRFAPPTATKDDTSGPGISEPSDDTSTAPAPASQPSPLPMKIIVQQIRVTHGRISISDTLVSQTQIHEHTLDDVDIEVNHLAPGQKITFQFALRDEAKPGLGSLKAQGTFSGLTESFTFANPYLELSATLKGFATETIKPYLSGNPFIRGLGGIASLDLNYTGDFGHRFVAKGSVDLGKATYTDDALWSAPLPGAATSLNYEVRLDPDQIDLSRLGLTMGNISVTGQGLIEDWRKPQPIFRKVVLKGKLPLVELRRLIPRGLGTKDEKIIEQLLEGGGEIDVENIAFSDFTPEQLSIEKVNWLEKIDASLTLTGISFKPSAEWPKLTGVSGKLRLSEGEFSATDVRGSAGPHTLPSLDLRATGLTATPRITAWAKGPIKLMDKDDKTMERLLQRYGIKNLSGDATIDMQVNYDWSDPAQWDAKGSLLVQGIQAEIHPDSLRLQDLEGKVAFQRTKDIEVSVVHLKGRVEQSRFEIDGKATGAGARAIVLDGNLVAESLDLMQLAKLVPALEPYQIRGTADLKVKLHYPSADPYNARISGTIRGHGMAFRYDKYNAEEVNVDIELSGQTADVKEATLQVNGQPLQLVGRVTDPQKPRVRLHLSSDNLDLDQLLLAEVSEPARRSSSFSDQPEGETAADSRQQPAVDQKSGDLEIPGWLGQMSMDFRAEFAQGQYRKEPFRDLEFEAEYEQGTVKHLVLDVGIGGGQLTTRGSVDLRKPARIQYDLSPTMNGVSMESVSRLIGHAEPFLHGPINMKGRLLGHTGGREESLASLNGDLEAAAGPGRIRSGTRFGDALFNLLSFIHIKGIFSGKARDTFAAGGMPYDALDVKLQLQDGGLDVGQFKLVTPAFIMDSTGSVDLVEERLKMTAAIKALKNLDAVLGFVPLVGKVAEDVAEVHLDLTGPLSKPEVNIQPGEGLVEGIESEAKQIGKRIKGLFKGHPQRYDKNTAN